MTALLPEGTTYQDLLVGSGIGQESPPGQSADSKPAPDSSARSGSFTSLIPVGESESNDTAATANGVPLGFGGGEDVAVDVSGSLGGGSAGPPSPISSVEDDGSIPLANPTGLTGGAAVVASGVIGDGPYGATSGDFDHYSVPATAGQLITVDVNASDFGSTLDSYVGIYSSTGLLLAANDDFGSLDSYLEFTAPADDTYSVVVRGFGPGFQADPFDSSTGFGVGSTGFYDVVISLTTPDIDYFAVDLAPGDIFAAYVSGGATHLTFRAPDGTELVGSGQNASFAAPTASPLPGLGNAALSYVIDAAGTYTIAVDQGSGAYDLNLRVYRPALEDALEGTEQILYLDFDGASIDATDVFGFGNPAADLSPLASYLPGWGLSAADEDAVIDSILAAVEQNFADVGLHRG